MGIVADPSYQDRMERAGIGSIEPEEGMEALENLLNGPLDQLALFKTSRADVLENLGETCSNEWINSYPQAIPSKSLQDLKETLSNQEERWDQTLSAGGLQDPEMETFLYKLLLANVHGFLKSQKGLLDRYHRWMQESFSALYAGNYLKKQDDGSYGLVGSAPDLGELWGQWDEKKALWSQDVNKMAQVVLMDACLRALPEILTGKKQAAEVIFPDSSMELVEGIYKGNVLSDLFNDILGETLVAYIKKRLDQDTSSQIRILEIGAGTGGTTAGLLPKLKPFEKNIQHYCYTDLSKAFLMHAQKNYAPQAPYLTTQLFNVEKPISGQGIKADRYDIVVAANVLHATRSIRQTLRNAKATLRKGGILLLNELSDKSLFSHLTFGLLEGRWMYEDRVLRISGSPGLYPETWARVLKEEGFVSTFFPLEKIHPLGQQIIVAQSDGIVRQPLEPPVSVVEKGFKIHSSRPGISTSPPTSIAQRPHIKLEGTKAIPIGVDVTEQMIENHVRTTVRESIADALKMEEGTIQDDRSFSEYGVDSIIAVNLVNGINKQFTITLETTVLFDYNNVDELSRYIIREYKSRLISSLQENVPALEESRIASQKEAKAVTAEMESHLSPGIHRKWRRNRFQLEDTPAAQDPVPRGDQLTYYRVLIDRPGEIADLRLAESAVPYLKEHEVRIAVHAFSLNFGDLLCVKGLYPTMPSYPFTPGFEASGHVVEVGKAVTSVRQGDAVIVGMGEDLGGQASLVTCSADQVFPKPTGQSFEEACALPAVALTMIDAFHKAQLKRGERILIQTATGGTGLIAVQLAQHYGAEIFATASSQHKLNYLEKLGVPHRIIVLRK